MLKLQTLIFLKLLYKIMIFHLLILFNEKNYKGLQSVKSLDIFKENA